MSSAARRTSRVPQEIGALAALFEAGPVAVLSGAGISTESGIPDYRGPKTRQKARNPIQYRAFIESADARKRYWARALVGWEQFFNKEPSAPHHALSALEGAGKLSGIITQNVDRLHHKAHSRDVVELHGALAEVVCLDCARVSPRTALQARLRQLNGAFLSDKSSAEMAPDGDAEVETDFADFRVVDCDACGGPLKPNVVFFGENVPKVRVERAMEMVDLAGSLLVVGSSLTVYSGYRFVLHATKRGIPVVIVNLGKTRGDRHAELRIDAPAGETLLALCDQLGVERIKHELKP